MGGPMQYDWCPYKKRRLGHRHEQREDGVKTQGEDGRLRAKERGLRIKLSLLTPWSWSSSFQNCERIKFCCLSHPVSGICYSTPSKLIYIRTPTALPDSYAHRYTHTHLCRHSLSSSGTSFISHFKKFRTYQAHTYGRSFGHTCPCVWNSSFPPFSWMISFHLSSLILAVTSSESSIVKVVTLLLHYYFSLPIVCFTQWTCYKSKSYCLCNFVFLIRSRKKSAPWWQNQFGSIKRSYS